MTDSKSPISREAQDFLALIEKQLAANKSRKGGFSEYGSAVMPVLELYSGLSESKERKAFQVALEALLGDDDPSRRSFAVDICLGFFVFREAIR